MYVIHLIILLNILGSWLTIKDLYLYYTAKVVKIFESGSFVKKIITVTLKDFLTTSMV